jgi:dehydrogenase/reductase SDR family member 7B
MRFDNKVIWITGASSGIGEALAYAFAKEGAKVILSARREGELERVKAGCASPEKVGVLPLDLEKPEEFLGKAEAATRLFGPIDILVNNAGISQRSLVLETSFDVDVRIMNVDFLSQVALTKLVLPAMVERRSGRIVVISSVAGFIGTPLRSSYAAAKHALRGYFDSLRAEVWKSGVGVTLIYPGYVRTNVTLNALSGDGGLHGKMDEGAANGMSPEKCAAKILNAVAAGKDEAMMGGFETMAVYLKRLSPKLMSLVLRKAKLT